MAETRISQVGTVFVPVADQDRALEFYLGKLGFETRTDTAYGEGDRWIEVAPLFWIVVQTFECPSRSRKAL